MVTSPGQAHPPAPAPGPQPQPSGKADTLLRDTAPQRGHPNSQERQTRFSETRHLSGATQTVRKGRHASQRHGTSAGPPKQSGKSDMLLRDTAAQRGLCVSRAICLLRNPTKQSSKVPSQKSPGVTRQFCKQEILQVWKNRWDQASQKWSNQRVCSQVSRLDLRKGRPHREGGGGQAGMVGAGPLGRVNPGFSDSGVQSPRTARGHLAPVTLASPPVGAEPAG